MIVIIDNYDIERITYKLSRINVTGWDKEPVKQILNIIDKMGNRETDAEHAKLENLLTTFDDEIVAEQVYDVLKDYGFEMEMF